VYSAHYLITQSMTQPLEFGKQNTNFIAILITLCVQFCLGLIVGSLVE